MEVLADIRARGDGDSVSSVSVKSPATSSHMNNFVSDQHDQPYSLFICIIVSKECLYNESTDCD